MQSLNRVIIIASEQLGRRICQLLSKTDLEVVTLDPEVSDADKIANADMAIEAVVGEMKLRKETLCWCDKRIPSEAVLATTLPSGITEMAAFTKRPQRFVGLHFTFNPFQDSCVVQIVKGLETSDETLEACAKLIRKTGATAIQVTDSPGLILDRVMALMINEATTMYVTKVATIEDIDGVARSCLNWPLGPFEFADIIGIDSVLATLDTLSREVGHRFLPCRLLRQMVAMGRLGKKANRGFYNYS
jgi:3-hydroxybutyryl-CoA dehydrogenase